MKQPPGLTRSDAEQKTLLTALLSQPKGYVPRTHLMEGQTPRYTNRLIHQSSPYLKQHAHNPVDWWPWGDAALTAAKVQNKPIFLSAGYATCHWCHVMEEESFDNEAVAALLNNGFIAIKLDREERPDVDQTYILATQFQNQHAGWPNSVWALPDGRPFHTGTYFQRGHFMQILEAISSAWNSDKRAEFEDFADRLTSAVATAMARSQAAEDLGDLAPKLVAAYAENMNVRFGGFSEGQQFPSEVVHLFLLDQARRGSNPAQETTVFSLDHITAGGLHDQLGGGFHRYTVDPNWRTPHFEKMLYNQALLLKCFTEAWSLTGNPDYARAVARIVTYLERDMMALDGVFFAAEDADSLDPNGLREEGAFYAWTMEQATSHISEDEAILLGLDQHPTIPSGAVPHLTPGLIADTTALDQICETLRLARQARPRPFRDEKVLMGWNGLMISTLAEAAMVFDNVEWQGLVLRAFGALQTCLKTPQGWQKLPSGTPADLTDLVWTAQAALGAFACGRDAKYIDAAIELANAALAFQTKTGRIALSLDGPIGPVFELDDGAMPSGESSALHLFADLETLTGEPKWADAADRLSAALSGHIYAAPSSRPYALRAIEARAKGSTAPMQMLPYGSGLAVLGSQGLRLYLTKGHTVTSKTDLIGENRMILRPKQNGLWTVDLEICSDQICYPRFNLKVFLP
ncbi:MAG: thioredoxin domain-containing protein [Pseudomonadota bacterium]